ncbi:MAG: hypothetical protein ACXW2U_10725 [Telluria sp.]
MYSIKILAAFVLPALLASGGLWLHAQPRLDSCLDSGGRWNYQVDACDGNLREAASFL